MRLWLAQHATCSQWPTSLCFELRQHLSASQSTQAHLAEAVLQVVA
ncbi:hypothetical protein [Rhodoferax sp.]|nr:hypothetical protein [Rhodoferax sp.]MDD2811104.1 hypothetical protein [Rhodoferax sp.]MDD4944524.1 hypothetical protein [Rhodoferax sp.]MDD5479580.1 hypothetical protein [Rhodoferax sp.]